MSVSDMLNAPAGAIMTCPFCGRDGRFIMTASGDPDRPVGLLLQHFVGACRVNVYDG